MLTLTPILTLNKQPIARRSFLLGLTSTMVAGPAFALDKARATQLVDKLVAEINRTINFGGSEAKLIRAFENIFAQYADVNIIARSALGPAARSASSSELGAFILAFRGYIARKYGKRFQEFIGSEIVVKGTKNRGKFFEVDAGKIERIRNWEEIRGDESVLKARLNIKDGQVIQRVTNDSDRHGLVIVRGDNDVADNFIRKIRIDYA